MPPDETEPTSDKIKRLLASLPGRRDEALSILNGCIGDTLDESDSSLALPMTLRTMSQKLDLGVDSLADQLPDVSSRICVLVHGALVNESLWRFTSDKQQDYGSLLKVDRGVTPIYVRYNSGLHISTNAQTLASLLDDLVTRWPVEVEEISLIGHSMGGLVSRSACYYGSVADYEWVSKVRRLFLLGAPSTGAPLEKLAHIASFTLKTILNPWTRLISWTMELRSAGIKDLRYGLLRDEDWQGQDSTKLLPSRRHPVPLLEGAEHFVAVGSLWKNVDHPVAKVLGDALVTQFSARAHELIVSDPGPFLEQNVRIFPKTSHVALVNTSEVYEQILDWWHYA